MSVTYQPSKIKRKAVGFMARKRNSPKVLKSRRLKGRWKLTPKLRKKD